MLQHGAQAQHCQTWCVVTALVISTDNDKMYTSPVLCLLAASARSCW